MAQNSHAIMDSYTGSVVHSFCDTVSDSEINNDITNSICKSEDSVTRQGCEEISTIDSRLRYCCKYESQAVSTTEKCTCHTDRTNDTKEILSAISKHISTDPIYLPYSNKTRTKKTPKTSIFTISSESPHTKECHSGDSSPGRLHLLHKFFHRRTMLKCLFYSVIVVSLCVCGGVFMLNHSPDTSTHKDRVHKRPKSGSYDGYSGSPEGSNIFMDLPYKSVPLKEFKKHLQNTRSVPDIMRLFLDKPDLTDDQVNSIVYMKSHSVLHGKRDFHSRDVMNDNEIGGGNGEKWVEHIQEFKKSPFATCSEPKPELVRVTDQDHGSLLTYFPPCAIVHRCRSETGCCPHGEECKPRKENGIEIIDKHFMVLKMTFDDNGEAVIPNRKLFAAKSFINHTACECQRVERESNCHKKCPLQFRKDRTRVDCDCTCRDANKKCRSIRRGIHPLGEADLECIKKDECIVPQCKSGNFDIATGFCPHFRRHKRQKAG